MALSELLDLTARIETAEQVIPQWDLHDPQGSQLTTSEAIFAALHTGSPRENDRLLLRLAELAHKDGGGSLDAAAVLAKVVLPGAATRLRGLSRLRSRRVMEQHAAAALWIACRTFPYRTRHWVATTISWQVFRATWHELGERGDGPAWAATVVAGDPAWWADETGHDEPEPEAAYDLADLLAWARSNGVVSLEDEQLLGILLRVVGQGPAMRASGHGLSSVQVSRAAAVECGMGASTVRRKVGQIVASLREAGPAYLTAVAS